MEKLTRLRRTYTESLADYKRRVHKLFETANIKIDSVVSDLFGQTGRNLIVLLCKESELSLAEITGRMDLLVSGHQDVLTRLDEIPGINKKSAQSIVSEIGITLDEFPSMAALASWAGLCSGNNESAGKRKSGRTSVRSHPLKTILIEVAWAAVRKKGSYYRSKYFQLKSRQRVINNIKKRAEQLGYELTPCMN